MEEMKRPKCPCHPRCPYRNATCHGTCWIYGLWKDAMEIFNKHKRIEQEKYNISPTHVKVIRDKQRKNYRRNSMKWT